MTQDEARLKYWEGIEALRQWLEYGTDSREEVLEEVAEDL